MLDRVIRGEEVENKEFGVGTFREGRGREGRDRKG